ncbi:MAG: DUF4838 domain-containing protein [Lentisphaeria bacterium]|nr:DUF4838 domain-containing protein [Lentisphaeria bacterium]
MKRVCCLAAVLLGAVNATAQLELPDPGFERQPPHQGPVRTGKGSASCFLEKAPKYGFWQNLGITVEPFALYRATIYIQGRRTAGRGNTIMAYHETAFGWDFVHGVPLPEKAEDWTRQEVDFCGPTAKARLALVENGVGLTCQYYLDDLSITRVLGPAEHIAALEAKKDRSLAETSLLAYYYHSQGRQADWDRLLAKAGRAGQVVMRGLMALEATTPAEVGRQLEELLLLDPLDSHRGGRHLVRQLLSRLSADEQERVCLEAVVAAGGGHGTAAILGLVPLPELDASLSLVQREAALLRRRAALERLRAVPSRPELEREISRRATALAAAEAALDEYRSSLGSRRISLDGRALGAGTHAIVLPSDPSPSERHAASELASHLEMMSGQSLPIVSEAELGERLPLIIGRGGLLARYGFEVDYVRLGREGIHLESSGGALVLAGSRVNGVLYAVYTFLEEYLGCRWFAQDCTHIPRQGDIALARVRHVFIPELELRGNTYPGSRMTEFAVRNKFNGDQVRLPSPAWGEKVSYAGFVHTFNSLVPPSRYAAEHPEYYSLIDGQRVPEDTQLCLTNPEVLEIALAAVRERLRRNPEVRIVSVSQNDNRRYCQCEKCMALAEQEGGQIGPLLHFVNAIANAIADEFPDISVDTLAYQYTRQPPKHVRPAANVIIRLCSIECCFLHPLETCPKNAAFVEDIKGWSAICRRLHIWDYTVNYTNILLPFPNFEVLQPNIDFFIRHGVVGIFEESTSANGNHLEHLRTYVMAKCLWDRRRDPQQLIQEFTDAYYGAAGPYVREYLQLLHRVVCHERDIHIGCFAAPGRYLDEPELLRDSLALFDRAEAAVAGDEVLSRRVENARIGLMYLQIIGGGKKLFAYESGQLVPKQGVDAELVERFTAAVRGAKVNKVANGERGKVDNFLKSLPTASRSAAVITLENDFLSLDIVPAMGGRIWRGTEKLTGNPIFSVYGSAESGYEAFEAGYEDYGSADYRGVGWNEAYAVQEKSATAITMAAKLRGGLTFTRRIELLPKRHAFRVTSSLSGASVKKAVFRTHPTFYTPDATRVSLRWRLGDGSWEEYRIPPSAVDGEAAQLWLRGDKLPAGQWAIVDPVLKRALVNTFDPAEVSVCYANWNKSLNRCNPEQWSRAVDADATSGPTITNTYEFLPEGRYPW